MREYSATSTRRSARGPAHHRRQPVRGFPPAAAERRVRLSVCAAPSCRRPRNQTLRRHQHVAAAGPVSELDFGPDVANVRTARPAVPISLHHAPPDPSYIHAVCRIRPDREPPCSRSTAVSDRRLLLRRSQSDRRRPDPPRPGYIVSANTEFNQFIPLRAASRRTSSVSSATRSSRRISPSSTMSSTTPSARCSAGSRGSGGS